jgi:hypothetical protein
LDDTKRLLLFGLLEAALAGLHDNELVLSLPGVGMQTSFLEMHFGLLLLLILSFVVLVVVVRVGVVGGLLLVEQTFTPPGVAPGRGGGVGGAKGDDWCRFIMISLFAC